MLSQCKTLISPSWKRRGSGECKETEMMYSLLTIVFYSVGVFILTFLTTSIPLLVHLSKATSKIINLVGMGLMLGTAFIVVVPEAVLHGCECPSPDGDSGAKAAVMDHLEAKNIGLAMVFGFITMMIADSLSHGSGDDHHHDGDHDNETYSDTGKEEVVITMTDNGLKRLRTSISGLCLHSIFDGLAIGSSVTSANAGVVQSIFGAILLHKISASLGVGIFIKQLHVSFNQGEWCVLRVIHSLQKHSALLRSDARLHRALGAADAGGLFVHSR